MASLKINPRWLKDNKRFFLVATSIIVGGVLILSCLKGCTQIGSKANNSVYVPTSDGGFVGKTNRLLAYMVAKADTTINPHNIDELNRMYPGLRFQLPLGERSIPSERVTDIRLVDIDPEMIDDEAMKQFYYNSDLPKLLKDQSQHMGQRLFRLRFRRSKATDYKLRIDSIYVVPSQFKVALEKDPWRGNIIADDGSLFRQSQHCFLSWGRNVMPIRMNNRGAAMHSFSINTSTLELTPAINYYNYYRDLESGKTQIVIKLDGRQNRSLKFDYPNDSTIRIKVEGDIVCQPYCNEGLQQPVEQTEASSRGTEYPFDEDLRLIISYQRDSTKIAELALTHNNPLLTLSTLVNSNTGKRRYKIAPQCVDRFSMQLTDGLVSSLSCNQNDSLEDIRLSIDPLLSLELQNQLETYYKTTLKNASYTHSDDEWELSMTVMDMATGNVVAVPYFRSADKGLDEELILSRKNPALTRRYIGSTFKPMLALAAVQTEKSLLNLNTIGKYSLGADGHANYYGCPCRAWAKKSPSHWGGRKSMVEFIAASDDVFPVALTTIALNGGSTDFRHSSVFEVTSKDIRLRSTLDEEGSDWTSNPFIQNLDALYEVKSYNDTYANKTEDMDFYLWRHLGINLDDGDFGLDNITPDAPTMHYETFFGDARGLSVSIVPWILGQGSNDWNTIKLAEAWTRMLTKSDIHASFIKCDSIEPHVSLLSRLSHPETADNVWDTFLDQLHKAQLESPKLLTPMNKAVNNLNTSEGLKGNRELILFSKTGTPDNYSRKEYQSIKDGQKWFDVGLYCMALMPQQAYESVRQNRGGKGIMCVIRVSRITNQKPTENGVSSSDARNLFSNHPDNLRRLYQMTSKYY